MGLYEFEENTEAVETESAFSGDEIAEIIEESSESSDEEMYVEDGPAFDDDSKDLKKKKRRKKKAIAVVKEVVSFVTRKILEQGKAATCSTMPDNYPMLKVIDSLGYKRR